MAEAPLDGPFAFPVHTWVIINQQKHEAEADFFKAVVSARLQTGSPYLPVFTSEAAAGGFVAALKFKGCIPWRVDNRPELRRILNQAAKCGVPYVGVDFRKSGGGYCEIASIRWS